MEQNLERYRVKGAPPSLYYIPDFISCEEEEFLTKQVYAAPKPRWTQLSKRRLQNWGGLPHPKGMLAEELPLWLQMYSKKIAELGAFEDKIPNHVLVNEYEAGQGIMPHEDGPLYYPTVSTISLGSHTLLNFYRPIEQDVPQSEATSSATSTTNNISYCSNTTNNSSDNNSSGNNNSSGSNNSSGTSFDERFMCSMLLQPRSLILVRDDMYKVYLHGIDEVMFDTITDNVVNLDRCEGVDIGDKQDRSTRVSLTIRYVPKLMKASLFLGKKR